VSEQIKSLIADGALFVVNHSGGKDSQAMPDEAQNPHAPMTAGEQEVLSSLANPVDLDDFGPPGAIEEDDLDLRLASLPFNDYGNGQRFVARFGQDAVYVEQIGWHVWDGTRYRFVGGDKDQPGASIVQLADQVHLAIVNKEFPLFKERFGGRAEKAKLAGELRRWGKTSGNVGKVRAMLTAAAAYRTNIMPDMDANDWVLNVKNGTLHLSKGGEPELKPHNRDDLITRRAEVRFDPGAKCPTWEKFLAQVLPDKATLRFIQYYLGYTLTGTTDEQFMVMFHGQGSNGKSTMMETVRAVMGDYAMTIPIGVLLHNDAKRSDAATPVLAQLPGVRLVMAAETQQGDRLSEANIKVFTGGEEIVARKLYRDTFSFSPKFKLALSINNKPQVWGQDHGIWRRIKMVPFDVIIAEADKDRQLKGKLEAEASGILNWLIDGLMNWLEEGLIPSRKILETTEEYRRDSNPVGEFIRDFAVPDPGKFIRVSDFYKLYETYCKVYGLEPRSLTSFGKTAPECGLKKGRKSVGFVYDGVRLDGEKERELYEILRKESEGTEL